MHVLIVAVLAGCEGVSPHAASISLELLAKCFLHHHTSFPLPLPSPHSSHSQMFTQVRHIITDITLFSTSVLFNMIASCLIVPHNELILVTSFSTDMPAVLAAPPTVVSIGCTLYCIGVCAVCEDFPSAECFSQCIALFVTHSNNTH